MRRSASSRFREIPSRDEEESLASSRLSSEEHSQAYSYGQSVPSTPRQIRSSRPSEADLRSRLPSRTNMDESVGLLSSQNYRQQSYNSFTSLTPGTPRQTTATHTSTSQSLRLGRHHGRSATFAQRLVNAIGPERRPTTYDSSIENSKSLSYYDERVWYDQFTSTDWVHDIIADAYRIKELRSRKDIRGKIAAWFDGAQGWVLAAIIGCLTATVAYFVNVAENTLFDFKFGYCTNGWYRNIKSCCRGASSCDDWVNWSVLPFDNYDDVWIEFAAYTAGVVMFSTLSCIITMQSKTVIPSAIALSTLDENLAADNRDVGRRSRSVSPRRRFTECQARPPMMYYSAAGSGVAEVKVILSGFVLHGYLGVKTLLIKTFALILSVASGLSLGKEGPYVHIATCIGNVCCRLFSKYSNNDGKRREILSASAASGVAVAFGAPIGGVLFSQEEVSYYFPPKTMFRTFLCCIAAALSLKFLNPYGTGKIVLFEVRYLSDWKSFEMVAFVIVGVIGGALGALFIKASGVWARTFRRIPVIKRWPIVEVIIVALITGFTSFWNHYTKLPVTELLFELASPCDIFMSNKSTICPNEGHILDVAGYLMLAFLIKAFLTTITFGIKVPAGIYVPSMVVGGLMGRIIGLLVQYLAVSFPESELFASCSASGTPEACVVPGVYAMVGAGATMCGVTRLSVTLAVILFELTGSLNHVLPFSIGVLVSKWTADALEPLSIYDLLTDMNSYPFLDNKIKPIFTSELGDITPRVRGERVIDISNSPLILAKELRGKLDYLHMSGELDGGLPIVRDGILVGLIPAPDLEFALDKLDYEENCLCLMSTQVRWNGYEDNTENYTDPTDFTSHIDPAPVALDIHSPMDLVYECFVKLGLRYICVLRDGRYAGLVHKKAFVGYTKEMEKH